VLALVDVETVVLLIDGRIGDRISDSRTPWSAARPRRYTPTPETLCNDLLEQVGPDKSDDIALLVLRVTSRKPRPRRERTATGSGSRSGVQPRRVAAFGAA
jgi:hypothetical protein